MPSSSKPAKWTSKREKFCRLIALHGLNATQAYYKAFDVKPDTKLTSVYVQASMLRKKVEVAARIEELQGQLYADDLVDGKLELKQHLANLKRLQDLAVDSGQFAPAITAEVQRGKASNLYIEKTMNADVSLADLVGTPSAPKHEKAPVVSRGSRKTRKR